MAISFPGSKSNGQKFTAGNKSWTWNGASWKGTTTTGGDATTFDSLDSSQFLRSDTSDVMSFNTTTGETLKFVNNTSGGQIQIGFQQNDTDGLHHRGYIRSRKSSAGGAAGIIEILPRQVSGGTGTAFTLEAGQDPKWGGNKVWHAGNDGSGSGLDADTVDGIQASSFLRSDASDTFTGSTLALGNYGSASMNLNFQVSQNGASNINFYDNNGTEGLFIHTDNQSYGGKIHFGPRWNTDENAVTFHMLRSGAGGTHNGARVGIGTTSPLADLHVQGNAVIGNIQTYETTNPSNSGATLHVHNTANDGGTNDGKVTFGDETQVIISTGAIDGGPQGYQGSLWFGTSDHPAGGSTLNSAGTQWNWKVAGIACKTDQDTGSENSAYGNLEFYTKGSNASTSAALAMTIDESQRVGIGTVPSRLLHIASNSNYNVDPYLLIDGSNSNRDSGIIINAGGGERKVVRGDVGGSLYFGNSNQIALYSSGSVIVNSSGAAVDFTVQSDTQSNMLYVDGSDNYVGIGTATRTASAVTTIRTPGTSGAFIPLCLEVGIASNGFGALAFANPNGTQGTITCGVSGVTYNTTSDRRLKDNIEPIADATDKLMDMKPVTHTWIADPEAPQVHGFIAQEMQEVVPEAVSGDAKSDEMMSMDYGRITPVIVAALQDALNEIKELKTRIDKLENK